MRVKKNPKKRGVSRPFFPKRPSGWGFSPETARFTLCLAFLKADWDECKRWPVSFQRYKIISCRNSSAICGSSPRLSFASQSEGTRAASSGFFCSWDEIREFREATGQEMLPSRRTKRLCVPPGSCRLALPGEALIDA